MGIGIRGYVEFKEQSAFGTPDETSMISIPILSESLTRPVSPLESEVIRANILKKKPIKKGPQEATGDISVEAHPDLIVYFLKAICGQVSTTGAEAPWVHVCKPVSTDFSSACPVPPHTIALHRDAGDYPLYSDLVANTMTIEIANGEISKSTISFLGGKEGTTTVKSPTYPTTDTEYTWNQVTVTLNSVDVTDVINITVTINNNIEARHTLSGSLYPSKVKRTGYPTVEISGSMIIENQDEYDNYVAQTRQPLIIEAINGTDKLKIEIPNMVYTDFPNNIGGMGSNDTSFTAIAEHDDTLTNLIAITATNGTETY